MNIGQTPDSDTPPVDTPPVENAAAAVADSGQPAAVVDGATAGEANPAPLARTKGPLSNLSSGGASAKPASPAAKPQSPAAAAQKPVAQRPTAGHKPAGNQPSQEKQGSAKPSGGAKPQGSPHAGGKPQPPAAPAPPAVKLVPPSLRQPLAGDLQDELDRELAAMTELDQFLGGTAGMANRREPLQDGQRVHGVVLKIHGDSVFVQLGGPDEGVVPFLQFTAAEPAPGDAIEVVVMGLSSADGLYQLTLPGEAVSVTDWSDIENGSLVEATVTGSNTGGLECTVAGIRGFMPISQISEARVEDAAEFVGQKFICLVTEANPRRGNLVLSRRAILERERQERRQEQIEQIEPGDLLEGVIRSVKDFGVFVDLGGLEGLIHISKLSWERIKHPSEVVEEGQKVKVKVDKIDKQTGKLSLSYRDLLENPWDTAAATIAAGAVLPGTVTRVAAFGAFVRIAAGVEGLVHISEVASHRVSNVSAFLSEGQAVDVKVLSIDTDSQKVALSIKQAQHKAEEAVVEEDEPETEAATPIIRPQHSGPLRGGHNQSAGGERFGLRW